jgi:hypothetical protein
MVESPCVVAVRRMACVHLLGGHSLIEGRTDVRRERRPLLGGGGDPDFDQQGGLAIQEPRPGAGFREALMSLLNLRAPRS